jgi:hypothetical protein
MKKIYSLAVFVAAAISVNAQESVKSNAFNGPAAPAQGAVQPNTLANGDTLMWMPLLGYYINPTDQAAFMVQTEDADGATPNGSTIQCNDWCAYFSTDASDIDPNQGDVDTAFFWGATSWFAPVGQASNWLEFGPITVPATGAHILWNYKIQDNAYRDGYEILVNTTSLSAADFTNPPIYSVADQAPSTAGDTAWTMGPGADLSAYAGQQVYIAFHHNANDMFILWIDNIIVIEGPMSVNENAGVAINPAMPNPANESAIISYTLTEASDVVVTMTDVTGKVVYTENRMNQAAGVNQMTLNTENLANGIYFYTVTANGVTATEKIAVQH